MARYVDGFVVPVPADKLDAYRRLSRKAGKIWREYGALEYVECVADDVKPGKTTSFPQSVKLKEGDASVMRRFSPRKRVSQQARQEACRVPANAEAARRRPPHRFDLRINGESPHCRPAQHERYDHRIRYVRPPTHSVMPEHCAQNQLHVKNKDGKQRQRK